MTQSKKSGGSVADAVNQFVQTRMPPAMVSTADGIRYVRRIVTLCEHSDGELGELIALTAVSSGRNVAFDIDRLKTEAALV